MCLLNNNRLTRHPGPEARWPALEPHGAHCGLNPYAHKRETPSTVIVIEALSQVLPDDTYLTELRILGDKMQIVGVTKNAPALIRLIEQTSHFGRAAFFAPTTRSASEQSEHFHIEAHIEPVYTPGL